MNAFIIWSLVFMSIISGGRAHAPKSTSVKWMLSKACTLKVSGSTNVNKFSCIIPDYPKPDTLTVYKTDHIEPVKITGSMILEVQSFDCQNPMMTRDLRKTLRQKEFPRIRISFISLSKYPASGVASEQIEGSVYIELAGIKKKFDINYRAVPNGGTMLTLVGSQTINFSDFNIVPPRKLGGMIKTNDMLSAVFVLKVNVLN